VREPIRVSEPAASVAAKDGDRHAIASVPIDRLERDLHVFSPRTAHKQAAEANPAVPSNVSRSDREAHAGGDVDARDELRLGS